MAGKTYRLAPELRRCCWYAVVAAPLLAIVSGWVMIVVDQRRESEAAAASIMLLFGGLAPAVPLMWRLRVDDVGVSRSLLGLQAHWPWEDFESGAVEKRLDGSLVHTDWAWWNPRRRLSLRLKPEDRREVLEQINQHFQAPEPPPLSEPLTLRVAFGATVELDENGVHLLSRRAGLRLYTWREVLQVDVEQLDLHRQDFCRLEITLPDQQLDYRVFSGNPGWKGASPEELLAMLRIRVAPDRLAVFDCGRPLPNRQAVERRVLEFENQARDFGRLTIGAAFVLAALFAWLAWTEGIERAVGMMVWMLIPIGAPYAWVNHSMRRKLAEWRSLLEGDAWRTNPPPASGL